MQNSNLQAMQRGRQIIPLYLLGEYGLWTTLMHKHSIHLGKHILSLDELELTPKKILQGHCGELSMPLVNRGDTQKSGDHNGHSNTKDTHNK